MDNNDQLKKIEEKIQQLSDKIDKVDKKIGAKFKYMAQQSESGISVPGGVEVVGKLLAATVLMVPAGGHMVPQVLFILENEGSNNIAVISADQCAPVK